MRLFSVSGGGTRPPPSLRGERLLDLVAGGLLAAPEHPDVELSDDQDGAQRDEHRADRPFHEHQDVTAPLGAQFPDGGADAVDLVAVFGGLVVGVDQRAVADFVRQRARAVV